MVRDGVVGVRNFVGEVGAERFMMLLLTEWNDV